MAMLASLATLDERGMAVRQTGGRDPLHEIQILGVPAGGSQPAGAGSRAPTATPSPLDKGKGAASSSSAPRGTKGRRKRGNTGCVTPTDRLFWTPPQWGQGGRCSNATEDCLWGRGGRLPGPGRAEARQSSATTTIETAATATATTIGLTLTTSGATTTTAAAAAGASVILLPRSLEGPGPK
jgi:hypothetical protein